MKSERAAQRLDARPPALEAPLARPQELQPPLPQATPVPVSSANPPPIKAATEYESEIPTTVREENLLSSVRESAAVDDTSLQRDSVELPFEYSSVIKEDDDELDEHE